MSNDTDVPKSFGARRYEVLNLRKRKARPKTASSTAIKSERTTPQDPTRGTPDLRGTPGIAGMIDWLRQIGHSEDDLNSLNVIHVAGTKGKGSTCAFAEFLLRAHGRRTGHPRKTGLYTSPHLMRPEERIRINSQPLDPDLFARYVFEICDHLPQALEDFDTTKSLVERGPRILQFYALLAFHVFIREKVDVTILETHCGGEYDATNIVPRPLATVVTTLGMDHIDMLGPTIENIAWHKSGIFKSGSAALSTTQIPAALKVLQERSRSKNETLRIIDIDPRLPSDAIQIRPLVQKKNVSLAIAAAEVFLEQTSPSVSSESHLSTQDIDLAIRTFSWPGRFHIVPDGTRTWFLDAAHNDLSVDVAAQWFAEVSLSSNPPPGHSNRDGLVRVLIFSHENELRDATALLQRLAHALRALDPEMIQDVVFTTYKQTNTSDERTELENELEEQLTAFRKVWQEVWPETGVWEEESVEGAMKRAESLGASRSGLHALITGSQHLVGPALRILNDRGVGI